MDTTNIVAQHLARAQRALAQLTSRGHTAAHEPVLELRLWQVQQARLCRHSLAVAHARAATLPSRAR